MPTPKIPPSIPTRQRFFSRFYSLRQVNSHILELTPTGAGFCLLGSCVALVALLGWAFVWHVGFSAQYLPVLSAGMLTIPLAIVASYLVLRIRGGRIRFDCRARTVCIKPYRYRGWKQWMFDDFLLVQMTASDESGALQGSDWRGVYQVNLTYRMDNGEVALLPLLSGNRKNILRRRAQWLAEFMGLPLISETTAWYKGENTPR